MKARAPIILSFVVGALVTVSLVGWGWGWDSDSDAVAAQPPVVQQRFAEGRLRPSTPVPIAADGPALISIPRLDLKARVGLDLKRGPAWWPVTGRPGGGDTVAIAGHRTTYTRPFYWLERLQHGDSIYVRWGERVHAYRVSGRRVLSAKQLHIADARGHELLLLSACTPRGSARQRIVVYAWPRASS